MTGKTFSQKQGSTINSCNDKHNSIGSNKIKTGHSTQSIEQMKQKMYRRIRDKQFRKIKEKRMMSDNGTNSKHKKSTHRRRMIPKMILNSTDRKKHNCLDKEPHQLEVIQKYDIKFGKLEKFIKGQHSIDRFCKQYYFNNQDQGLSIITSSNVALL